VKIQYYSHCIVKTVLPEGKVRRAKFVEANEASAGSAAKQIILISACEE
jgi:hypothetical protein